MLKTAFSVRAVRERRYLVMPRLIRRERLSLGFGSRRDMLMDPAITRK